MPATRHITVDDNVPYGLEAFRTLGEVRLMPGRAIKRVDLARAEALCVRSITKVNAALLEGTPVRFVGTTTIGVDHVDQDYLRERGITFASAPGCNANSVSEYVTTALLVVAERLGVQIEGRTIGVVGVGNVGSKVVQKARALGMNVVLNDPPLARATGDPAYRPIQEVQAEADIVTFHVPLTTSGPDATKGLVDGAFIERLKPGVILLNTSRGPVADGQALSEAITTGRLAAVVLDVWENEPEVDLALLDLVDIGTQHIAGHSFDGKVKGTQMIYEAACRFFGETPSFDATPLLPGPDVPRIDLTSVRSGTDQQRLRDVALKVYDIWRDDADLRKLADLPPERRGAQFDSLRKNYYRRREFPFTEVLVPRGLRLAETLGALGFRTRWAE